MASNDTMQDQTSDLDDSAIDTLDSFQMPELTVCINVVPLCIIICYPPTVQMEHFLQYIGLTL